MDECNGISGTIESEDYFSNGPNREGDETNGTEGGHSNSSTHKLIDRTRESYRLRFPVISVKPFTRQLLMDYLILLSWLSESDESRNYKYWRVTKVTYKLANG